MDDPVKTISGWVDVLFRPVSRPIGQLLGSGAGGLAGLVAPEYEPVVRQAATQAGESFPRFLTEAALYTRKNPLARVAGLTDVAARSYAHGGTIPGAIGETAAFAVAPSMGTKAAKMAEPMAGKVAGAFKSPKASYLAKEAVQRTASTAGAFLPFEAAGALEAYRTGQQYDPLSTEHVIGNIASSLPFEALQIPRIVRGFRDATGKSMVSQVPTVDQAENWRVHWEDRKGLPRSRDIGSKQLAFDFADEMRRHGFLPMVELAGTVQRQYVRNEMAFRPEQLQGPFGLQSHEVLNEMPQDKSVPGRQLMGTLKNKVPPQEWSMLEKAGIGDLFKEPRMPKEVLEWIGQKGLRVEAKVLYGKGGDVTEIESIRNQSAHIQHRLETLDSGKQYWDFQDRGVVLKVPKDQIPPVMAEEISGLVGEYNKLSLRADALPPGEAPVGFDPDIYRPISMRDAPQKVVMVRVPFEAQKGSSHPELARESTVLHRGTHFGSEDVNILGWSRGFDATVNGKDALVLDEVQKDWGQPKEALEFRDEKRLWTFDGNNTTKRWATEAEARAAGNAQHPLLKDSNRLTLKATIVQAVKEGKQGIVLPDAETAMMTEGHDLYARRLTTGTGREKLGDWGLRDEKTGVIHVYGSKEAAESALPDAGGKLDRVTEKDLKPFIKQESGMRLNYDTILPKIMSELTGVKGERVDLGEHQRAFRVNDPMADDVRVDEDGNVLGGQESGRTPRPNLIFKNPDGTPKTHATGLYYNLSKTSREFQKRGGFPLFGSGKYVKALVQEMQHEGYAPEQIARAVQNVRQLSPLPNETPIQTIAREAGIDPKLFATLAPNEALPRAFDFLTSMFHHVYGEPVDRAAVLARQVMIPLARFAPFLKQTSFAMAPHEELRSSMTGTLEPKSEVFKYLITLHEFGKREYKNDPERIAFEIARSLGHEAMHNSVHDAMSLIGQSDLRTQRAVIRALAQVEAIPVEARRDVLLGLLKLIVPPKQWPTVEKINYENPSPEEFLADFAAILSVGSSRAQSLKSLQDALTFGDRASQDFSRAIYRNLMQIWSGTRSMIDVISGPNIKSNREAKMVAGLVDRVYENLTKIMATSEQAERTLDAFHGYMERVQHTPLDPPPVVTKEQLSRFFGNLGEFYTTRHQHFEGAKTLMDALMEQVHPEETTGARLSFWRDNFKPMGQLVESLKEKVPSAIRVFGIATDYRGLSSQHQQKTWLLFDNPDKPGFVDWKRLRWIHQQGSPQNKAFNSLALVENVRTQEEGAVTLLTREEREEVSSEYKSLSDVDKDKVDLSMDQMNAMGRFLAKAKLDAFQDRVGWGMTKVVMSHAKDRYDHEVKPVVDEAIKAFFIGNGAEGDRILATLPIAPAAQVLLKSKIVENWKAWSKMGNQLMGPMGPDGTRPGKTFYLPEVRLGDWHIAYKLRGQDTPGHVAFKTNIEMAKKLEALRANPDIEWVKPFNQKDRAERFKGLVQEDISAIQQDALDILYNSTLSAISMDHPEAQGIIDRIKAEVQPASAFANIATSPYMREREFAPGREDLNMVEGMVRYVDASAYNIAKGHVKQAAVAALFNPDFRASPNVRNEFERYIRFITDSEGKEFTLMKNLVFFNYIGLNPATMLQEPTQQLMTLVPYLVEHGKGIGEAYKAVYNANKAVTESWVTGKLSDPLLERAMKEAIERRLVDTGYISDLYGETDYDFAQKMSSTLGADGLASKIDLLKKPLYQLTAIARKLYGSVTANNSRVAFLTTFLHEYGKSHSYEKAMEFATQGTYATMYGGGKAARPLVLQKFGQMNGIGGLMYTLGSYSLNTVAMMGRLGRKAILDSTLKPEEKKAAMKAFSVMLTTQLAFAGVLGLPLVAPGLAILEQIFPGFDGRKVARELAVDMASVFTKDDIELGHQVSDAALRGLGNLSGVDFGSRFQLANMLGVSPYDGFSWNNLAGPAATMLENWFKATGQASQGRFGEAFRQAAPTSVKNIANLVHDDWAIRDKAGRLVSEMTPWEKVLAPLGFKSQKITSYYEEQNIRERVEKRKLSELRDIRTEAAKLLVLGDTAEARRVILQGVQDAGPYDPTDMAREAAQLAQDMQNPVQARSAPRASGAELGDISRLYPHQIGQTEVQRLLATRMSTRQMGLGTRPSSGALRNAALVDRVMKDNPRLTLPEARALVEQMTSRTARRHSAMASQPF